MKELGIKRAIYYRWLKKLKENNELCINNDISNNQLDDKNFNIRPKIKSNKKLFKMILSYDKLEIKEILNTIIKYIDSLEEEE
jgi:hypothetical protein